MQAGRDPGVTDLFAMLREEGKPSADGMRLGADDRASLGAHEVGIGGLPDATSPLP